MWCQWRYRDIAPDVAWCGKPSPWRSRVDAVLWAFASRAGTIDRAARDLLEAFGKKQS